MAQYEQAANEVLSNLTGETSELSDGVKSAIEALVSASTASGAQTVKVQVYDGNTPVSEDTQIVQVQAGTQLTQDPGAPVVIMDAGSSANVTFGADSRVETVVLGDGGGNVTFEGSRNVTVETTGGSASVTTGAGDDHVVVKAGDVTVHTGEGQDSVTLQGDARAQISGGTGDTTINLETDVGTATIDAGDGFDRLHVREGRHAHHFEFRDGRFHMHSENAISMTGVQVVSFDKDGDGDIDNADNIAILAANANDSLVGKLYKIALGREAIDGADGWGGSSLGGVNWWMNEFEKGETDGTTEHLVRSFLNCDEFHQKYDGMSNQEYVATLLENLGHEDPNYVAQITQQLDAGTIDREQVAWDLAASDIATQILGINGENYVIEGF